MQMKAYRGINILDASEAGIFNVFERAKQEAKHGAESKVLVR